MVPQLHSRMTRRPRKLPVTFILQSQVACSVIFRFVFGQQLKIVMTESMIASTFGTAQTRVYEAGSRGVITAPLVFELKPRTDSIKHDRVKVTLNYAVFTPAGLKVWPLFWGQDTATDQERP
eukprot:TRINITY_DN16675_c0_g1_i2.p1 TRINITY_DN16675_c0_g1~~TRINITY_DN16675_c0_g1_i2.p1  ORF type:complete len:122 (-),score=5.14 TRINITY_DN16675_c0_g1_i2:52-417(-)